MKKLLFFALISLSISCSKDESTSPSADEQRQSVPYTQYVPSSFTQKLMMEMYSTVSCATCPDAEHKYRLYAANNPDKVYGVCVHTSDAMASPQFNVLDNLFFCYRLLIRFF